MYKLDEAIKESKLDKNDIDYIIQIGGSLNIPKTKKIIQKNILIEKN